MQNYDAIPGELKALRQWVCWQSIPDETRPGRIKKIPVNAITGGQAQSNNPSTWTDYEAAVKASFDYSGIGFMFANGYFGVDLDGADDAIDDYKNGLADNIVAEFIHTLQSYAEYSVSGRGVHVICKGELPPNGRRRENVEMYSDGRFFIMTGRSASEYTGISECTQRIKPLHEKYIGGGREPVLAPPIAAAVTLSEAEILDRAMQSKQGRVFSDLYNGQWELYFTSQSEADMSFCNMLAFWFGRDTSAMDRIYRASGLMRPKWDRRQSGSTYGALLIGKAASECKKVYEPKDDYAIHIGGVVAREEKKIYSFDDTGNAQRMADQYERAIRYSFVDKRWFFYDNRKWCTDNTGVIKRLADDVIEGMRADFDYYMEHAPQDVDLNEYEKQFNKHVKMSRSSRGKAAMVKETEHRVPILPSQLDRHNTLLNTPNGIINLRTGELEPHDEKRYLAKITIAEYTDKTDCPLWMQFLREIFDGDASLIRYIQKAVGYSISGSTQEQCAFFCYGTGKNGKSTFLDTISGALGDYAMNVQPETLMIKNQGNNGANSDIARLKGARFVTSPEPNEGVRLNEGLIKQLTGGDKVTARKLYGDEFEFEPEFKLWMGTNHKPIIRGTDTGIWRRVHLIPFTVQIPEDKIDRLLKHKLKRELPGILKWAVEGCMLWQREGLDMPRAVKDAVKEYRGEMDVVSTFLDECVKPCIGGRVKASTIYKAYADWAEESNEYKMSARRFGQEMGKRYSKEQNMHGVFYLDIVLLSDHIPYSVSIGKA